MLKEIILEKDIELIYVPVNSFPEGVPEAFAALESRFSDPEERACFGLYEENKHGISYHAAIAKKPTDNLAEIGLKCHTIEKGKYLGITITDWRHNIRSIGPTFVKLFRDNRVDKNSLSIERYRGDNELDCMVKMID